MSSTAISHPTSGAAKRLVPAPARAILGTGALVALVAAAVLWTPWAVALWIVPDLALLAGWGPDMGSEGRMAPRAVPFYNAVHALPGPIALLAIGVFTGPVVLALGLTWLSHVVGDRAMGYGLRDADGWQRG